MDYSTNTYNNDRLYLRLTYTQKPNFSINQFVDKIAIVAFSSDISSKTLDSYEGSYLEVIETSVAYLAALRLILFFLNGSFKQVSGIIDTAGTICTQITKFPSGNSMEKSFGITKPGRGLIPAMKVFKVMKDTDVPKRLSMSKDLAYLKKVETNTECEFQRPASPKKRSTKSSTNA
jgi:hypothetical protein